MAKCPDCRKKEAELLTTWERVRYWLAWRLFPEDLRDERSGFYTAGFGDGYTRGVDASKEALQPTITALTDEIKELQQKRTPPIIHSELQVDRKSVV